MSLQDEVTLNLHDPSQYIHINHKSSTISIQPLFIPFKWMDKVLLYNFMWISKHPDGSLRHIIINAFGFGLTILQIGTYTYLTYGDIIWIHDDITKIIHNTFNILYLVLMVLCRLVLLWYFMFTFDYPWNHIFDNIWCNHELYDYYSKLLRSTAGKLKLLICIYALMIASHYYGCWAVGAVENDLFYAMIDFISSGVGVLFPIQLAHCVVSTIFLKYEIYLYSMRYELNSAESTNFKKLLRDYHRMYNEFVAEYRLWQIFFGAFLLICLCIIWVFLSQFNKFNETGTESLPVLNWLNWAISGIICYSGPGLQFVWSASNLNNEYKLFVNSLWNYEMDNLSDVDNVTESTQLKYNIQGSEDKFLISCNFKNYQLLLQYINSHPLQVRVLGMEMTKMNAMKCLLMFSLAKIISYSMYSY